MRIPEIREELFSLARRHRLPRLAELAEELRRRPPTRRAPIKSKTTTETLSQRIRAYAEAHPKMPFQEIGEHFGVNAGRVSEAVSGKRT